MAPCTYGSASALSLVRGFATIPHLARRTDQAKAWWWKVEHTWCLSFECERRAEGMIYWGEARREPWLATCRNKATVLARTLARQVTRSECSVVVDGTGIQYSAGTVCRQHVCLQQSCSCREWKEQVDVLGLPDWGPQPTPWLVGNALMRTPVVDQLCW